MFNGISCLLSIHNQTALNMLHF